jgi:acetyl-CoA decarbonylase/synthase complex subunit delta
MAEWKLPVESYKGKIVEVTLGKGAQAVKVGGENVFAFNQTFDEGTWPNPPKLALEIWDKEPVGWSEGILKVYGDSVKDPAKWVKKAIEELNPDLIFFYLLSTDPLDEDRSPEEAAKVVKEAYEAGGGVPFIVYGTGNDTKDPQVLSKVAQALKGENLLLGPALKEDYEPLAQAAKDNDHCLSAQVPMDINLQKELNVKISRVIPRDKIIMDPLAPCVGVGLEYGFSIFERQKHAAISFGDEMMQMPMIANFSLEVWKTKEAKENEKMGIMWEELTGMTYLLAGANILVVRHPEAFKKLKGFIEKFNM